MIFAKGFKSIGLEDYCQGQFKFFLENLMLPLPRLLGNLFDGLLIVH